MLSARDKLEKECGGGNRVGEGARYGGNRNKMRRTGGGRIIVKEAERDKGRKV